MLLAVIDRIENNLATILIESLGKELTVDEDKLPEGSKEGTWLNIEEDEDSFKIISINHEKTNDMEETARQLMGKLKPRKRTSRFKRK